MFDQRFKRAEMSGVEFARAANGKWGQLRLSHIIQSRPDLSIENGVVTQWFHSNVPAWNHQLLAYKSVLDAIEHHWRKRFGDTPMLAMLVENQVPSSGSVVTVYDQPFVPSGEHWDVPTAERLLLETGAGTLWSETGVRIERDVRSLRVDGLINMEVFTTMVRWRWPECRVYSNFVRGDEGCVLEQPLAFEL